MTVCRRRKLTISFMSVVVLIFYFYIFTSTISMDAYRSKHRSKKSSPQESKVEPLDLVPQPQFDEDDLLEDMNIDGIINKKLFRNKFLSQEISIGNIDITDSGNTEKGELIQPMHDSGRNLTIRQKTANTHDSNKDAHDISLKNNNNNKQINAPPRPENDNEHQKIVDQNVQFQPEAAFKTDAVVGDSNRRQVELRAEIKNNDCTEVSKSKTYSNVTFPEFIAFGRPGDPGENGQRFVFSKNALTKQEEKQKDTDFKVHYFDEWISKKIAVHRSLPDDRPQACRKETNVTLPAVSVLIVFYNEAWTTLLRTIHSILDRTPEILLKEIILLDDFSNMNHLKEPLELYLQSMPKVRLFRAKERLGLIRARNLVFDLASGKIVVFLDSHVECFPGWLEPLLVPIVNDNKAVTFPSIEYISPTTFAVGMNNKASHTGGLRLSTLSFDWLYSRSSIGNINYDNKASPTMPGGLYAISSDFFRQLGKYDPGMDVWGAENLEISFKVWMCGGSLLLVPCSHVGHIFRTVNPALRDSGRVVTFKNAVRVAEVWMDQYKHFFYEKIMYIIPDYGDVSSRVQLRNSLKCHDFGWYLDNVYPELKAEMDVNVIYAGQIKNDETNMCLNRNSAQFLSVSICSRTLIPNQFWTLLTNGAMVSADQVIGVEISKDAAGATKTRLGLFKQGKYNNNVHVAFMLDDRNRLLHRKTGLCLQVDSILRYVLLKDCSLSVRQKWRITRRKDIHAMYKAQGIAINWNQ